ncbi:hypothetical protein ACVW16_001267 [Bradyrhizobium sp. USDA 4474]
MELEWNADGNLLLRGDSDLVQRDRDGNDVQYSVLDSNLGQYARFFHNNPLVVAIIQQ